MMADEVVQMREMPSRVVPEVAGETEGMPQVQESILGPTASEIKRAAMYTDPEWRRKQSESQKNSPRAKQALAKLHSDPEVQRRLREGIKRRTANPEWRRKHYENLARLNTDVEHLEQFRRMRADPRVKRKNLEQLASLRADPQVQWKRRESIKNGPKGISQRSRLHSDPEVRRKNLERLVLNHADPVISARMIKCEKPSREEMALRAFLPPCFLHAGQDGSQRVLGFFPDYKWPERKLIVEMDGHFRHRTPDGIARDAERDRLLVAEGYRVLHVHPRELKDSATLLMRIAEFIGQS